MGQEGMRLGAGWCKCSRGQRSLFLGPTGTDVGRTEVGGLPRSGIFLEEAWGLTPKERSPVFSESGPDSESGVWGLPWIRNGVGRSGRPLESLDLWKNRGTETRGRVPDHRPGKGRGCGLPLPVRDSSMFLPLPEQNETREERPSG